MTIGSDYSRGKYGDSRDTETWAYPVMFKFEQDSLTWKVSIPYIHTRGPSNVVGTGADRVVTGTTPGVIRTETGWGDTVGAVSWAFYQNAASREGLDLTGKIKFATGDKNKGLSTGENDYSLQLDGYKVLGGITSFATLGKKFMGDPSGIAYRDPLYSSIGAAYKLSSASNVGASFDWRDKVTARGSPVREVMLFLSHRFTSPLKLQLYFVRGYSDASPDLGGGVMLGYGF